VSPRVFRVVALPAPTEREKSQMYIQRYLPHLPAAGEVVIFDRSWYNRAGVERVMGFCTPEETERFLELAPAVEKAMVDSGILLLKYWLEVSAEEQTRRLERRIEDPRKVWKLSDMDLRSYSRWYDYSRARDAMFAATDTAWAPWYVARTDDKQRGRLNIISHLLSQVPYKPLVPKDVTLPKRQRARLCGAGPPVAVHPDAVLNGNAAPRVQEQEAGLRPDGRARYGQRSGRDPVSAAGGRRQLENCEPGRGDGDGLGGADGEAATGEPGTTAMQGPWLASASFTANASAGATAAMAQGAVAQGLAGGLDPARRSVVTEAVVRAGGGIVWRRGAGGGVEIVLVHRPVYDDWSFPKGKLDPGETEAQAALREVQEETGLRCRLGREVGTSAYRDPKRRSKTVRYWEMTPTAGTLGPANEIDDARWVPLQEAPRLLTYERDRRLLEGWQPAG
jgi:polyphosphate kinase 2